MFLLMSPHPLSGEAVRLRLAGFSRSQIKTALGVRSAKLLSNWLKGVPPPDWTARPNAKDDLHAEAVALRLQGKSYNEIRAILGVAKSTLSCWLRDVALTEEHKLALAEKRRAPTVKRAQTRRALRLRRNEEIAAVTRADITELSERELFIAGVVAYWAEGTKNKPWGKNGPLKFINSDAEMIQFFLSWLRLLGVDNDQLIFRVHIHESADVVRAVRFWADVVGADPQEFRRTTLKRHNPKTVRKNVGDEYHGCLVVGVRRSNDLNLMITGWCQGLAAQAVSLVPAQSGMV